MPWRTLVGLSLLAVVAAPAAASDERVPPPGPGGRPGPRPAAPVEAAERPAYAIGHKWFLTDGTYELKRLDGRDYVFVGPGRELRLTPELAVAGVRRGADYVDFRPPPRLKWPLRAGLWGSGETNWRVSRLPKNVAGLSTAGGLRVTWQVRAPEDVTVPAGRFTAWRIDYEVFQTGAGGRQTPVWQFSTWYAPAVRQLVKADDDGTGWLSFEVASIEATPPAMATGPTPPPPPATTPPVATPAPPARVAPPTPSGDTEAPRIVINYPPADIKLESERIVVLGVVSDNVGVDRVQVTVNGVEVPLERGMEARGRAIRVPATLRPGDNVIEITATDKAGNVAQVVRTITRVVAVAPPSPAPVVKTANRWAVIIGVGTYANPTIPRLRYATRDAEAMYRFLTTKGGYPKDNVLLLTDGAGQKPTLQNIRRALGEFLYRKPGREDMVLIYYAGHGAPEVDTAGNETDGLAKYLIPMDAEPESLYSTALPMDEIQRIFARIPAERIVMLLDTCYSGTAGGRTFMRQQIRAGSINDQFLERLTRSRGRVIITASGPNEVALESSELGHGVFTYFLLQGLAGKADRNGDGVVTVSELYEYVEEQVDRKARAEGGRQRPLMKGEVEGTLPLARVGK